MKRTDSGLWIAPNFSFLRKFGRAKGTTKTVNLLSGERAKVWVDDSRTVRQTEHGEHLDALVRPQPIRMKISREQAAAMAANHIRREAALKGWPQPGSPLHNLLKGRK